MKESDTKEETVSEQQEKINAWFEKWGEKLNPCDICGAKWAVPDHVIDLDARYIPGDKAMGVVYPCIPIICPTCGNSRLVNAIIAGIVPGEDDKPVPEKKEPGNVE
jgi:hypothetical protein